MAGKARASGKRKRGVFPDHNGDGGRVNQRNQQEDDEVVEEATSASTAAEAYEPSCSPLRTPYMLDPPIGHETEPAVFDAYMEARQKYFHKLDMLMKLPTLDKDIPLSRLTEPDPLLMRESVAKSVLQAAKFVLGLSAYIDGQLLNQCSGILMECNEGTGTVLTSAHLIRSKSPLDEWLGQQEYVPNAEVHVQMSEDTHVKGQLMYYHKHYEFALISIPMDQPAKTAYFSDNEVKFTQDVIVLRRDKSFNLQISNGRVQYKGPGFFERHHYMYIDAEVPEGSTGGPVIDSNGSLMGMTNLTGNMTFIPHSIIDKCLHLLRTFGSVPRLHLGLKLSTIKFLDPSHKEKIFRKCNNIDAGLIVNEVSGGSIAEKLGIRMGDIIQSVNGECLATTVELEKKLLEICENHLIKGYGLDSNVDVLAGIFYTSKCVPGSVMLTANVSEDMEVVARGKYLVSAGEGISAHRKKLV